MAPRKPQPALQSVPAPASSGRVTKTKSKTEKGAQAQTIDGRATQNLPLTNKHPVKKYSNDLLNVEETPAHLVVTVQRNATDSPLLRLPAEIRNQIWRLAMGGGHLVFLPDGPFLKGCAMSCELDPVMMKGDNILSICFPLRSEAVWKFTVHPVAFHLPEVCRQIYVETSLTSYSQNTFYLQSEPWYSSGQLGRLTAAQRGAIKTVQLDPSLLFEHLDPCAIRIVIRGLLAGWLPGLETFVVTGAAVAYMKCCTEYHTPVGDNSANKNWKSWITQKLKYVHGSNIEVRFEDET